MGEQQLSRKASVDARDECKCTALMYAATYGHIDAVRVLLDHGSDIEATSKDGWTSLITATYNGHIDVVQYLIQRDANIEAADERGWTPLMHVAFNGDIKTLKCLLENGASVEAMDTDGRTALVYAAFNGHAENVGWLLERCGTDASDSIDKALLFSSIHGHDKVVQLLLDAGAVSQETRHAARKLAEITTTIMWSFFLHPTDSETCVHEHGGEGIVHFDRRSGERLFSACCGVWPIMGASGFERRLKDFKLEP